MNNILSLRSEFQSKSSSSKPGPKNIPKNQHVEINHLIKLKDNLIAIENFWKNEKQVLDIPPLVSAYYIDVIAKSNRIKNILKIENENIVGAKFTQNSPKKHIITYCLKEEKLSESIKTLKKVIEISNQIFQNSISHQNIEDIQKEKYQKILEKNNISKTNFVSVIVDAYYLESFGIEKNIDDLKEEAIITLYNTGNKISDIMKQLNIDVLNTKSLDETTILLRPNQFKVLKMKAPYLISMAISDISTLDEDDIYKTQSQEIFSIPDPTNEPTIGVIDTMFDERVYFSKWVQFKNKLDKNLELNPKDFEHGTMVSSIIVDGHNINPELNDGCGRFKVRHFGVAKYGVFSSFTILKLIQEIVESNKDIKVWNLSLGSALEINSNFISPEAAILDKIQYENDVIFVVAGTNKSVRSNIQKIGAPADSINSLVVNSVNIHDNKPTKYSRKGLVLSFFNKPDISYYGGDEKQQIRVCSPNGEALVSGTSFAAPWISRKMAFLIHILGFTRELAKALIIDSATGWENSLGNPELIGFGVVPIKIDEIIKTPKDEIKFLINGTSEKFETYNYNIPIPEEKGKQPFVSKATLCYFSGTSRNQGVDYTNTELDIYFGRVNEKTKRIESINDNKQYAKTEDEKIYIYEGNARKLYRKWDNVKHIRENLKTPSNKIKEPKSKKSKFGLWGICIKSKERFSPKVKKTINFGLVITLKEVNQKNRIEDFIQQCQLRGWIVKEILVNKKIEIYNKLEEEIEFE